MTGIGYSTSKAKNLSVDVTVKSVNGRYLDVRVHLPENLQKLELDIRKKVSEAVRRGSVTVIADVKSDGEAVAINYERAGEVFQQLKNLSKKLKIDSAVTLDVLTRFPNVIGGSETEIGDPDRKAILKALDSALEACNKERKREGQATLSVFKNLLGDLKKKAEFILAHAHPSEAEVSTKLLERLEKLGLRGEVDSQRLAQEVVMQLEKCDVAEESERILEHIKGMSETLLSTDPVGKKLEFYTQELFREFNTVGSKSQDAEVTKVVIDSKVIIERLREQVQNVE